MHIDEHFTNPAVFIFAGSQINLMPTNSCLLCIAFAAMRQAFALGADHPLDHFFNHLRRRGGHWCFNDFFFFLVDIVN